MLVGITGSIGVGKTTLATMLESLGARLIEADPIGHEVIELPDVRSKLKEAFGAEIENPEGQIDRRELGRRAFADDESRSQLNRIVQAPLNQELWRRVEEASREVGERGVVIVDAALIVEWGQEDSFDALVVVVADESQAVARLENARGLSESEIRDRMASQSSSARKVSRADFVVENNGDVSDLESAARRIWQSLMDRR